MKALRIDRRDRGSVLLLTLVVVVALGLTAVALSRYAATSLRASNGTEDAVLRQTAADGAIRAALDVLDDGALGCLYADVPVPVHGLDLDFAGVDDLQVSCESLDGPLDDTGSWAAVITGQDVPTANGVIQTGAQPVDVDGNAWISSTDAAARAFVTTPVDFAGRLVHVDGPCPTGPGSIAADITFSGSFDTHRPVCTPTDWRQQPSFDDPPRRVADLGGLPAGSVTDVPVGPATCRVYRPGAYDDDPFDPTYPDLPSANGPDVYFRSGDYVFLTTSPAVADWNIQFSGGSQVIAGKAATMPDLSSWDCVGTAEYTTDVDDGATFYLSGRARVVVDTSASLEIMERVHTADDPWASGTRSRTVAVSIQALCDVASWCDGPGGVPASSHTMNPFPGVDPNRSVVRSSGASALRFHGMVYIPLSQAYLEGSGTAVAFDGGLVAARLWSEGTTSASPPTPAAVAPVRLLLTATATTGSTVSRVQAALTYDADAAPAARVVVNSWRLCGTSC